MVKLLVFWFRNVHPVKSNSSTIASHESKSDCSMDDKTDEEKDSSSFSSFFNTIFVSSQMYPENPEGTQVIVGSMNMGYIPNTYLFILYGHTLMYPHPRCIQHLLIHIIWSYPYVPSPQMYPTLTYSYYMVIPLCTLTPDVPNTYLFILYGHTLMYPHPRCTQHLLIHIIWSYPYVPSPQMYPTLTYSYYMVIPLCTLTPDVPNTYLFILYGHTLMYPHPRCIQHLLIHIIWSYPYVPSPQMYPTLTYSYYMVIPLCTLTPDVSNTYLFILYGHTLMYPHPRCTQHLLIHIIWSYPYVPSPQMFCLSINQALEHIFCTFQSKNFFTTTRYAIHLKYFLFVN